MQLLLNYIMRYINFNPDSNLEKALIFLLHYIHLSCLVVSIVRLDSSSDFLNLSRRDSIVSYMRLHLFFQNVDNLIYRAYLKVT